MKKIYLEVENVWEIIKEFYQSVEGTTEIKSNDKTRRIYFIFNDPSLAKTFSKDSSNGLLSFLRNKLKEEGKDPMEYNLAITTEVKYDPEGNNKYVSVNLL